MPDAARTEALKPGILEAIKTVFDPEIPVDIWELGLIYDVFVDASGVAGVRMTLTAPAVRPRSPAGRGRRHGEDGAGRHRREGRRGVGAGLDQGSDVGRGETAVGNVVTRAVSAEAV